jgi:hypothetical protein
MCSPAVITGVQTGISMVGTYIGAQAQDQKAEAIQAAAKTDLLNKYSAIQTRETQEIMRTNQDIINVQKQGVSATSRARVFSSAGGVSGASAQERAQQPANAVSDYAATAKLNLTNTLAQNQLDAESARAKAQSTIDENQTENPWAVGLDLLGEAAGGASKAYDELNPPGSGGKRPPQTGDVNFVGFQDPAAGLEGGY